MRVVQKDHHENNSEYTERSFASIGILSHHLSQRRQLEHKYQEYPELPTEQIRVIERVIDWEKRIAAYTDRIQSKYRTAL